jgi:hypothetical protein
MFQLRWRAETPLNMALSSTDSTYSWYCTVLYCTVLYLVIITPQPSKLGLAIVAQPEHSTASSRRQPSPQSCTVLRQVNPQPLKCRILHFTFRSFSSFSRHSHTTIFVLEDSLSLLQYQPVPCPRQIPSMIPALY